MRINNEKQTISLSGNVVSKLFCRPYYVSETNPRNPNTKIRNRNKFINLAKILVVREVELPYG